MKLMKSKKVRRIALPLLAASTLGIGAAVAATVTLSSTTLGSGAAAVSSCTTSATAELDPTSYTYSPTASGRWVTNKVKVTLPSGSVGACVGKSFIVVVADTNNSAMTNGTTAETVWPNSTTAVVTLPGSLVVKDIFNISAIFWG